MESHYNTNEITESSHKYSNTFHSSLTIWPPAGTVPRPKFLLFPSEIINSTVYQTDRIKRVVKIMDTSAKNRSAFNPAYEAACKTQGLVTRGHGG